MLTVSGLLYRRVRRAGRINIIGVAAAVLLLVALLGGVAIIGDLLLPVSEPLIAAPLRW